MLYLEKDKTVNEINTTLTLYYEILIGKNFNVSHADNILMPLLNNAQEEFDNTKEVISNRRTDNTMSRRKRTNNDLQNIHIKLKIE